MKRLGKVFLGMLCMILLFACYHKPTPVITEKPEKGVTFEWDAVTNYNNDKPIGKKDGKVKYMVYVYQAENIDEQPPNSNDVNDPKIKELRYKDCNEIEKTSCKIRFDDKDKGLNFFLGVQALLKNKDGKLIGNSTISWSCNNNCTNNNPRYVKVSVSDSD